MKLTQNFSGILKQYMKLNSTIFLLVLFVSTNNTEAKPTTYKTGHYQFIANIAQLVDVNSAQVYSQVIDSKIMLEWEVYVPGHYSPDNKPGLLVYISPFNSGKIPKEWLPLLDKYNLIWIAANQSGNKVNPRKRLIKAVLATSVANNYYKIDTSRIYITGFSGGGRMASIVASQFPQLFNGAIYNCGANYWRKISNDSLNQIKKIAMSLLRGKKILI